MSALFDEKKMNELLSKEGLRLKACGVKVFHFNIDDFEKGIIYVIVNPRDTLNVKKAGYSFVKRIQPFFEYDAHGNKLNGKIENPDSDSEFMISLKDMLKKQSWA